MIFEFWKNKLIIQVTNEIIFRANAILFINTTVQCCIKYRAKWTCEFRVLKAIEAKPIISTG